MGSSEKRSLLSSTGLVGAFTLLSRVLGLVRDAVIASHFGTSVINDIFQMAFEIPNFLRRVLGEGALSAFIVPVFAGVRREGGDERAWRFVNNAFNVFCVVTLALTALGCLFPQPLFFLYGGAKFVLHGEDESFALGCRLLRIMFPFLMLLTLTSILMGVLHARKHFFAPALGSTVLNVAMIVAGGFAFYVEDQPRVAAIFAASVVAGAVVRLLILLPPLWRQGWRWRPAFDLRDTALHELSRKMLPAFFGLAVYQLNIAINLTLANWLGEGCVSYLRYGNRVMQFPLAIFATALSTALLPQLTEFVLARADDRLRRHVSYAVRVLTLVYLPATVGLIVLGRPIIELLFERGAWTAASSANTQFALAMYALGLLPVGLMRILTPVYYAQKDMVSPVKYGALTVAINTLLCLALMRTPLGYGGLALASSLAAIFNAWLLFRGRRELLGRFWTGKATRAILLGGAAAVAMGAVCHFGHAWSAGLLAEAGRAAQALLVLGWVAAGGVIYLGLCYILRLEDLQDLIAIARRKKQ